MEQGDKNIDFNEVDGKSSAPENKKKNYFHMIMTGILLLFPFIFLFWFLYAGKGELKEEQKSATTSVTQTTLTTLTAEQHVVMQ